MRKFSLYSSIIIALSFTSCVNKPSENATGAPEKIEDPAAPAHEEGVLSLNEGKRWEANSATTQGVNNMIAIMSDFSETESYESLADTLQSEFKLIFKNCTMTGEAHNQLHNFLFPMKEKFKMLASADSTSGTQAYEDLNQHLSLYAEFFK